MKVVTRFAVCACVAGMASLALATGVQWTPSLTINTVEIVQSGGFVVYLSGWSDPACSSNPTGVYIYANDLGVTSDGVKAMLAAALMAQAAGKKVTILYDNTNDISAGLCYGEYLEVVT